MKEQNETACKRTFGFFVAGLSTLVLAGCSTISPNNSALLLDKQPTVNVVSIPEVKPLPSSSSVFAQTVDVEQEEVLDDTEIISNDPHEAINRKFFVINSTLDKVIIRPVSKVYGALVPGPIRLIFRNGLRHLEAPGDVINYVLQGNPKEAGTTLKRFVINSTLGIGGAFDIADHLGTPYNPTDFGLTLADWNVGEGRYIVHPLIGPSTARDSFGRLVDIIFSPQSYFGLIADFNFYGVISRGVGVVDKRNRNGELIDNIIFASPDPYVTLRSTYLQRRRSLASDNILGADGMEDALPVIATAGQ